MEEGTADSSSSLKENGESGAVEMMLEDSVPSSARDVPSVESEAQDDPLVTVANGEDPPVANLAENGAEDEEIVVINDDEKTPKTTNSTNGEIKTARKQPPELLPIDPVSHEVSSPSEGRLPRKAALKSSEITKVMTRIEQSRAHSYREDEVKAIDESRGETDADAKDVVAHRVQETLNAECTTCSKLETCIFRVTGPHSKKELYFCSKRCVQVFFKYANVQYESSHPKSSDSFKTKLGGLTVRLDALLEPIVEIATDETADMSVPINNEMNGNSESSNNQIPVPPVVLKEAILCKICKRSCQSAVSSFAWEGYEFCSKSCLGNYMTNVASSCSYCSRVTSSQLLGKMAVRYGKNIRQFCSTTCLDKFKLMNKLCPQCQGDLPDKNKSFCSVECDETQKRLSGQKIVLGVHACKVCSSVKDAMEKVVLGRETCHLCSLPCRNAFLWVNKSQVASCTQCMRLIDVNQSPSFSYREWVGGLGKHEVQHRFCCASCFFTHLLKARRIVMCVWCRVRKYDIDMIRKAAPVGSHGPRGALRDAYFCSLCCFDLYLDKVNAPPKNSQEAPKAPPQIHTVESPEPPANPVAEFSPTIVSISSGDQVELDSADDDSTQVPVEVWHKIISVPRAPKTVANKSTWCSPFQKTQSTQTEEDIEATTAAIREKTMRIDQNTQTDKGSFIPVPIPIPFPVYVPVPMGVFTLPCPTPVPLPIPLPIPLPLPVPSKSAAPTSQPFTLTDDSQQTVTLEDPAAGPSDSEGSAEDPLVSLEETVVVINEAKDRKRTGSPLPGPSSKRPRSDYDTRKTRDVATRKAWSQWVRSKEEETGKQLRPLGLMSAEEMCSSLVGFVNESRSSKRQKYRPDELVYFLYGLQEQLMNEKRVESFFSDSVFEELQRTVSDALLPQHEEIVSRLSSTDRLPVTTCLTEAGLWSCGQLGSYSPHVLVFTMLYFNTKYFRLYSLEQHLQLVFPHLQKGTKTNSTGVETAVVRYVNPQGSEEKGYKKPSELSEKTEKPERCPVKLFSFYLKKCPQSVRNRSSTFYLTPEPNCTADSPVWFSSQPFSRETLEQMLQRVLLVEDVLRSLNGE